MPPRCSKKVFAKVFANVFVEVLFKIIERHNYSYTIARAQTI